MSDKIKKFKRVNLVSTKFWTKNINDKIFHFELTENQLYDGEVVTFTVKEYDDLGNSKLRMVNRKEVYTENGKIVHVNEFYHSFFGEE